MPSGFLISSAEDMAAFLIAQLNGGRVGTTTILSPDGVAAMQVPGVATGSGERTYGLGWMTGSIGAVPAVFHSGDHPNVHTLVFMQPGTRRGAVLLINLNNVPALATAFRDIENGVARLLAEQEPARTSVSLPTVYLLIDALLGAILALALWPLVRMRRWFQRLRQRHPPGRGHLLRLALRLHGTGPYPCRCSLVRVCCWAAWAHSRGRKACGFSPTSSGGSGRSPWSCCSPARRGWCSRSTAAAHRRRPAYRDACNGNEPAPDLRRRHPPPTNGTCA